jgi:hypothetical protein
MQSSVLIDNLVSLIIECKKSGLGEEHKRWKERVEIFNQWKESLKVKDVKAGEKIDIKDTEQVWCVGVIELKIST